MALAEDLDAFLADFGVPCAKGATNFTAIFDAPGDVISLGGLHHTNTGYSITYKTSAVTLANADSIIVNGVTFRVRETLLEDDASFSKAHLSS